MTLRKGEDIARRLEVLAAAVVRVASSVERGGTTGIEVGASERKHVAMQLVRVGTSCGANYEEARGAQSRADFIHKVSVAAKEARETAFWLRMLDTCNSVAIAPAGTSSACAQQQSSPSAQSAQSTPSDLARAIDEAEQLAAILTASARTARRNSR